LDEAYARDHIKADETFKGKFIAVSGAIGDIGKDMVGKFYIVFKTVRNIGGVQCFFDKAYKKEVLNQPKDRQITIIGRCDGKIDKVQLRKCRVEGRL
jgi:hypothetical protein